MCTLNKPCMFADCEKSVPGFVCISGDSSIDWNMQYNKYSVLLVTVKCCTRDSQLVVPPRHVTVASAYFPAPANLKMRTLNAQICCNKSLFGLRYFRLDRREKVKHA